MRSIGVVARGSPARRRGASAAARRERRHARAGAGDALRKSRDRSRRPRVPRPPAAGTRAAGPSERARCPDEVEALRRRARRGPASRNAATRALPPGTRGLGHRLERRDGLDRRRRARVRAPHAVASPTRRPVNEPGPAQTAMRSQSSRRRPAAARARAMAGRRSSEARRSVGQRLLEEPSVREQRHRRVSGSRCRARARSWSVGAAPKTPRGLALC